MRMMLAIDLVVEDVVNTGACGSVSRLKLFLFRDAARFLLGVELAYSCLGTAGYHGGNTRGFQEFAPLYLLHRVLSFR